MNELLIAGSSICMIRDVDRAADAAALQRLDTSYETDVRFPVLKMVDGLPMLERERLPEAQAETISA